MTIPENRVTKAGKFLNKKMFRNYFSSRISLVAFSIVCDVQALVPHFSCEAVGDVLSLIVSARRGSINLHIWSYIMLASYFLHHKYSNTHTK